MSAMTTIFQIRQMHFAAVPVFGNSRESEIFRVAFNYPHGRNAFLVQIQLDCPAADDDYIEIQLIDLASQRICCASRFELGNMEKSNLDELILIADIPSNFCAELVGVASVPGNSIRLRHIKSIRIGQKSPSLLSFRNSDARFETRSLASVFIGTTNECNANCPHCPTNKKMTSHLQRGSMSMEIFEKLVNGLDSIEITQNILFGVFGEPFEDSFLEERIRFLKKRRPEVAIEIATNGALADLDRVAKIIDDVRSISIHVEAVSPIVYDKMMAPLKARDVFSKIDILTRSFGEKVKLTTPLHGGNVQEVLALKSRWRRTGAKFGFSQLQTRATDQTLAKRVCLGGAAGFWDPELTQIMVVDWDGLVLATCDDFLRRQPLGDLKHQEVREILAGERRRRLFDALCEYRWSELPSLVDAIVDDVEITNKYANIDSDTQSYVFHFAQFQCGPGARMVGDGIVVGPSSDGSTLIPSVFGPYIQLSRGDYHVTFSGVCGEAVSQPHITLEVATRSGSRRCVSIDVVLAGPGAFNVGMKFVHDDPGELIEFRIFSMGGETQAVKLSKVQVSRLY